MREIKKILVSQPRPATEHNPYAEMESKYGVTFDFRQLIRIEGLNAHEFRQQRINPLDYTAVILNSRLGIDHYFRLMQELRLQVPDSMHYYCISEAVGNYLQKYIQYRKRKVFAAEHNNFEDLLPAMNRRPQEKYLMVMSDVHNDDIINMFAEHKIEVKPAVMYRTVSVEWKKEEPFDYDMIVLFTPSGVQSIKRNFPDWEQGDTLIAAFGQNTVQALEDAGFHADIKVPTPECPSITAAIEKRLEQQLS
ncbi:MAG: uroporphyrinogen-III synthase [Paludibacteraceae bacterium]|jgi:uroporphyrinogen-III synthase|nr:uroporphyrinogen-III synthase [Paludibacteraceae bacterium]MBP5641965.1 uroporphyrinogen-III synthase [Paludibacteraceae bacterium]MBQ4391462.1 uroporphyrinogen-III synthase [Paludibacteraceae bacterium]